MTAGLKLTRIGGYDWATIEGEYCIVHAAGGTREVTGTIVTTKASAHVYGAELRELRRDETSIEVRLDEPVRTADDARALQIEPGDFVSFDPRTTITPSGFIKSRHLDDKACVAILLGVARALMKSGEQTRRAVGAVHLELRRSRSRLVGRATGRYGRIDSGGYGSSG